MISDSKVEQIKGMNMRDLEERRDSIKKEITVLRDEGEAVVDEIRTRRTKGGT